MSKPNLSVVVPVRNQQFGIERQVEALLDQLAELTSQVELMIVDDGSKDATHEVLDDLRRKYPQISVLRLEKSLGASEAAELAAKRAHGEFVVTQESYEPISIEELQKLWALRDDQDFVMATAVTKTRRIDSDLIQKLTEWGRKLEDAWDLSSDRSSVTRMFRRNAVQAAAECENPKQELEISHVSHRSIAPPKIQRLPTNAPQTLKKVT